MSEESEKNDFDRTQEKEYLKKIGVEEQSKASFDILVKYHDQHQNDCKGEEDDKKDARPFTL